MRCAVHKICARLFFCLWMNLETLFTIYIVDFYGKVIICF